MDFSINYESTGKGKPLFFQHGLGADLQQSQDLLAGLPNTRLITMDCAGHGKSPLINDVPPTFQNYAKDLYQLMIKENIEQAVVGGISMGSGIALNFALEHPERVNGLIILRPAWLDKALPKNLEILSSVAKYLGQVDGMSALKRDPLFQKIRFESNGASESILGQFARNQGAHVDIILRNMIEDRPLSSLQTLKLCMIPTLILANHMDPLHPFEIASTLHEHLPNSEFKEVFPRYEDYGRHQQEVRAAVSKFLEKIN